jgi:hypothetical protein
MALAADSSARFAAEAMMRRRLWAFGVSVLVAACGEPEPEDEGLALSADCPALCSGLESVGQLVSLSALTYQASSHSTKLTRAGDGWAAVWSDEPPASYFQRFDAAGSIGSGFRIPDADGATQHWDGSSMAVWTYRDQTVVGPGRELSFARIGSGAQPPEFATLSGPENPAASLAYDLHGAQVFAYWTPGFGAAVRQLRVLPGLALEQRYQLLSQAEPGTRRLSLGFTGSELAVTFAKSGSYRTTFLDADTLAETRTVDLGRASGDEPQAIQSVMGDSLLWVGVWEMTKSRLWLRAIDVAAGAPATEPILVPWTGTLESLVVSGDEPLIVARPHLGRPFVQPETDAVFPFDLANKTACAGTRFSGMYLVDLELDGSEGAALVQDYDRSLFFTRVRCR